MSDNKKGDYPTGHSASKRSRSRIRKARHEFNDGAVYYRMCWEDVDSLFAIASGIRRGKAPVFASKMCHFLFPKLFIVMDNQATSIFDYEFYWRGMKDEWCRFKDKAEASNLLRNAIRSSKPLHPLYPLETKIMELSHIGHKHDS